MRYLIGIDIGTSGTKTVLFDEVIRPSIIRCDGRTAAECGEITEKVGRERLIEISTNPALAGFTASKIMWVKNMSRKITQDAVTFCFRRTTV